MALFYVEVLQKEHFSSSAISEQDIKRDENIKGD